MDSTSSQTMNIGRAARLRASNSYLLLSDGVTRVMPAQTAAAVANIPRSNIDNRFVTLKDPLRCIRLEGSSQRYVSVEELAVALETTKLGGSR